ncbi:MULTISPECIES: hypothetical protein [Actibacterium]
MAAFRDQNKGHLVVMSSMSAIRGMRGAMTAYATSKAGVALPLNSAHGALGSVCCP